MPELDAKEVFRCARSGGKIEDILTHVKNGNLLMQLAVAPEINRRYEFPYRSEMPMFLLVPDNEYLKSPVSGSLSGLYQPMHTLSSGGLGVSCSTVQVVQDPYLKPIYAAELDDPLLSQVSASKWTNVISNDVLFRRLLSNYFIFVHPLLYCFHMKYFLRDLVDGRTRFCSRLLVNVVLGAAYVSVPPKTFKAQ